MVWLRYIDDIFFIWTDGEANLKEFLEFVQGYSAAKKMKSKIRFEVHQSRKEINFLDVIVQNNEGRISTTLYSKPTDSHLYLHPQSCHPEHIVRNIPRGQFLRLRRICSDTADYISKANKLIGYFKQRGYNSNIVEEAAKQALKTSRESLLGDSSNKEKRESQSILVTTWHPKLKQLSSILKKHFHLLQNDKKLKKVFTSPPLVAFRKKRSIRDIVVRNDIKKKEVNESK